MRETAEAADAAPRRGIGALLLVALLALVLAVGLASHHDEVPAHVGVAALDVAPDDAIGAALPAPLEEPLVACSFLLLCAVALLLAGMRVRRPATAHPREVPRVGVAERTPLPQAPAFPPSLDLLSISRT